MKKLFAIILFFVPIFIFGQTTPTWKQTLNANSSAVITKNVNLNTTGTFSLTSTGLSTIASPSLAITGTSLQITNGGGASKILTSDANGVATWQVPSGAVSSASVTITDDNSTNATMYPTWVTANTGGLPVKVSSTKLKFNPSNNHLTLNDGSTGLFDSEFNIQTTKNALTSIGVENQSTGTSAGSSIYLAENSGSYLSIVYGNKNYTGNFPITSIPRAGLSYINSHKAGTSAYDPILIASKVLYAMQGWTTGNYSFRMDSIGFRTDLIQNIHTYNTMPFQIGTYLYGTTTGLGVGITPTANLHVSFATAGSTYSNIVNTSSNAAAVAENRVTNNTGEVAQMYLTGSAYTPAGLLIAKSANLSTNGLALNIITNGGTGSDIVFSTNGTAAANERMRIKANATAVGIGTTSPNIAANTVGFSVSSGVSGTATTGIEIQGSRTSSNALFGGIYGYHQANQVGIIAFDRGTADNSSRIRIITSNAGSLATSLTCNQDATVTVATGLNFGNKAIDAVAGDAATINGSAGRFRKDTSGNTFTLTNSFIATTSIIILEYASDPGITGFDAFVVAGSGSAVITFTTSGVAAAPTANTDVNFIIIN